MREGQFTVRQGVGLGRFPEARELRRKVFIEEQGVVNEFDEVDDFALHVLLCDGEKGVATARLFDHPEVAGEMIVGRVAVAREYRGQGLGASVMAMLEAEAKRRGAKTLALHAQTHAQGFYADLGFVSEGPVYLEENIPHITMRKCLD